MRRASVWAALLIGLTAGDLKVAPTRRAWAGAGRAAVPFLNFSPGARPAALGEAYAGVSGDALAGAWNPAAFATVRHQEVSVQHLIWFEDVVYNSLMFGTRAGRNFGVGVQAGLLRSGDIKVIKEIPSGVMGVPDMTTDNGSVSSNDLVVGLSGAWRWKPDLALGLTAKVIDDAISSDHATAVAGDAGALWTKNKLGVGVAVQNVGSRIKNDPLPAILRAGVAWALVPGGVGMLEADYPLDRRQVRAGLGAEYLFFDFITARAGYRYGPAGDIGSRTVTAGLGLKHEVGDATLLVDYAFMPGGELGQAHRLSLRFVRGGTGRRLPSGD